MLLMDEEVTSGSELALPPFAFYLVSYLLRVNDIALYKVVMEIVCKMCRLTYAPIAPSYTYAKVMMSREIVGLLTRCIHRLAPRAMPRAN